MCLLRWNSIGARRSCELAQEPADGFGSRRPRRRRSDRVARAQRCIRGAGTRRRRRRRPRAWPHRRGRACAARSRPAADAGAAVPAASSRRQPCRPRRPDAPRRPPGSSQGCGNKRAAAPDAPAATAARAPARGMHVLARRVAHDAAAFGEQARVARARLRRIALADHRADGLDAAGELAHMRLALLAVAVEQRVGGAPRTSPLSTAASFQARLATSRMPWHMPWPRNGGCWCAASPATNTRPSRQRSATSAWKR